MAKASFAPLAFALVVLAIAAGSAHCKEQPFQVQGHVYCDTCRVLFQTKISQAVPQAEVELVCKNMANGTETLRVKTTTDEKGHYELRPTGEHDDDICTITAVRSSLANCQDRAPEINAAEVDLGNDVGFQTKNRFVNPIGFRADKAAPECIEVLNELGFGPLSPKTSLAEEMGI